MRQQCCLIVILSLYNTLQGCYTDKWKECCTIYSVHKPIHLLASAINQIAWLWTPGHMYERGWRKRNVVHYVHISNIKSLCWRSVTWLSLTIIDVCSSAHSAVSFCTNKIRTDCRVDSHGKNLLLPWAWRTIPRWLRLPPRSVSCMRCSPVWSPCLPLPLCQSPPLHRPRDTGTLRKTHTQSIG